MKRNAWHILREGETLTLARHLPARFDVSAQATFPLVRRGRLARQIRQDMWRLTQKTRGFSPVVEVRREGETLSVTAGGRMNAAKIPPNMAQSLLALLNDPHHRERWLRWAGEGQR